MVIPGMAPPGDTAGFVDVPSSGSNDATTIAMKAAAITSVMIRPRRRRRTTASSGA
jgi:hypothetical protein